MHCSSEENRTRPKSEGQFRTEDQQRVWRPFESHHSPRARSPVVFWGVRLYIHNTYYAYKSLLVPCTFVFTCFPLPSLHPPATNHITSPFSFSVSFCVVYLLYLLSPLVPSPSYHAYKPFLVPCIVFIFSPAFSFSPLTLPLYKPLLIPYIFVAVYLLSTLVPSSPFTILTSTSFLVSLFLPAIPSPPLPAFPPCSLYTRATCEYVRSRRFPVVLLTFLAAGNAVPLRSCTPSILWLYLLFYVISFD